MSCPQLLVAGYVSLKMLQFTSETYGSFAFAAFLLGYRILKIIYELFGSSTRDVEE